MIKFNGKEYRTRETGGVLFAELDLQFALFKDDEFYEYVSEEAERLDERIGYFLDPEEFDKLSDEVILKLFYS